MIIRIAGVGLSAGALLLAGGSAMAEPRLDVEFGANGGYATSPFGAGGSTSDTGAATLSGSVQPTLRLDSPTSQISLTGKVTRTEFSRRYKGTTDFVAGGSINKSLSEVTTLTGGVNFSSVVRNLLNPIADPSIPPGTDPDDPIIVDPTSGLSLSQRTKSFGGTLALNTRVSARDSITVSARTALVRFANASVVAASDYDSFGGAVSYRRAIGENSSIGISGDVGRTSYEEAAFGESTQYSPSALFTTRLAPRVSLDLSAGVTFVEFERLTGRMTNTSFSGSASLCHLGDRARLCVEGTRRVTPSTLAGPSNITSVSANYNYLLDELSSVTASASYSRSRSIGAFPGQSLAGQNLDYGFASATYNRRLMERLSAVVSIFYSDSFNAQVSRASNVSGTVGIRYRLGEL